MVECIHGYLEYASVMSSQLVPKKLMAWSICTLLHDFSGSIQGWFGALAGTYDFQHTWGIDGIGPQCQNQDWASRLQFGPIASCAVCQNGLNAEAGALDVAVRVVQRPWTRTRGTHVLLRVSQIISENLQWNSISPQLAFGGQPSLVGNYGVLSRLLCQHPLVCRVQLKTDGPYGAHLCPHLHPPFRCQNCYRIPQVND